MFVETKTSFKVCGEAGHGGEAIEQAKRLEPDLILLDLSMPVLGGAEAASIIKRMLPDTKIILFSMHMDNVPRSLAKAIGVDLTLSKMDGITHLEEHLKSLLAPEAPVIDGDTSQGSGSQARLTSKPGNLRAPIKQVVT